MKSKRVLTILLSMAIMLTFMPVMSFADSAFDPTQSTHVWGEDADETKSIAATCYSDGLNVYSCEGNEDLPQLTCEAIKATYAPIKGYHTLKKNPIQISKDDLIKRLQSEWGLSAEEVDALYKQNADNCYAFAYECKECGKIPYNKTTDGNKAAVLWQGHKAPAGTPECAVSYVCEFCGATILTGVADNKHSYGTEETTREFVCGDATEGYGYKVTQVTCSKCGYVKYSDVTWVAGPNNKPESAAKHGELVKYVKTPATCEVDGEYGQYCKECGNEVPFAKASDAVIPKLGHAFSTINFPATCTTDAYTYQSCSRCTVKNNYKYDVGSRLGHSYKAEVLFAPNCDATGITRITCTNANCPDHYSALVFEPESGAAPEALSHFKYADKNGNFTEYAEGSKIYFVGKDNEYFDATNLKLKDGAIEVADWHAKKHDWGKFGDMKPADCTSGAIQAAKCSVCGHYDVHTAVETGAPVGHKWTTNTQNPTCGAKGFTYDVCSVCGDYTNVKQFGEPKVAYGAKCDFSKWVVETAATPFEEGTKKLVCRNCGDDGHLIWYEGEMKESGVTRTAIAKTKIAAPKVKAGKKKATVTVKAVPGAVKYQIKVNGKVKKTVTSAKKVTIKKLKGGKKAKFQIVAYNAEGVKAASKVKSVKIKK